MKRSLLLALAALLALALRQPDRPPCQARLLMSQRGNLLSVTGVCRSWLDQQARYTYELRAMRHSAAGQSHTTQRGRFELPAQQQVTLSQVGFNLGSSMHYHLHLLVFDDTGRAVAQDSVTR